IGKAGTKFDIAKAKWYNEQYIRTKSNQELAIQVIADAAKDGMELSQEKA
ncbi:MAG TPA: glutamate--tRNA ligase, partial [Algoriphagus sp.]|nr:glutamate--tRNA ligase [Algoriphagus sp.]